VPDGNGLRDYNLTRTRLGVVGNFDWRPSSDVKLYLKTSYSKFEDHEMLGVSAAAIDKQRQRKRILGVPYGTEIRYPAAQFANGEVLPGLKAVLEGFADMNPWEQLMMLTTPLEGFGSHPETVFQKLTKRPEPGVLKRLASLTASWAA